MKRRLLTFLLIFVGLGFLVYPIISKELYDKKISTQTLDYEKKINAEDDAKLKEEWQKAVVYNQNLKGDPVKDPFIVGSGIALPKDYQQVLNFPDNTMAVIDIPKISVKLPVYHGTSEGVLQKGIGHMEGTSLPIGGKGNHSVLTGHSGLAHSKMFTDLTSLEKGDLFFIHALDKVLAYKVDQIKVVTPDNLKYLATKTDEDYSTLITCTPYGINSHRLLVRGSRTKYLPEERKKIKPIKKETEADKILRNSVIITSTLMLFIILGALIIKKRLTTKTK
ncbi:class C sortase [Vagococcus elongatus]|uniref:Class C sortase n=1 Tax=Vagococcus elongatus TaxID=180344 RepID=A0A430B5B8_9ENTE|nr:class C sortase [Vagococcus elongatus]RSU15534.1 class C sortase [Vagococcus elongatus]